MGLSARGEKVDRIPLSEEARPVSKMKRSLHLSMAALTCLGSMQILPAQVTTDHFGSGTNAFVIDFSTIGDAGNADDSTGYGGVSYTYRIGTYEISHDQIVLAGVEGVNAGPWSGGQPAAALSWYEAALFVNWLNTSTGHQAAYNFSGTTMSLWSSEEAWQQGGENLYRHEDAYYFLPSEDEWYKAAYYDGAVSLYYDYPTGSDSVPASVAGGTASGTAVYDLLAEGSEPADVEMAGGSSPYGTMGQGGNVWEMLESAGIPPNDDPAQERAFRGGDYRDPSGPMSSGVRFSEEPTFTSSGIGFRVASVPEPSSLVLSMIACLFWLLVRSRKPLAGRPK